jgi:DNA-binding response OmpR family regulator
MRNFKILIVDDETITLKIVKALLEKEGAIVFTAKNGEEALEILKTSKILNELPDIILTDIFMPEMDGFQFIQEVKNQKFIIPIVALTGKGDTQTVVKLFRNGISDYVEKPFSVKDVDIIRNILKRNKEHKERLEKEKLKQQEQLSAYEYSLKEHQSIINSAIMSYKNIINVDVSKLKIPVGYIFKPISMSCPTIPVCGTKILISEKTFLPLISFISLNFSIIFF